jgi:hypothetical protein
MKRSTVTGVLTIVLAVFVLSSARAQVPGGWSEASVKDKGVVQATQFAVKAQQQAMQAGGKKDEKITLVKILSARHQVVAGSNYSLKLQVRVGDTTKQAEATVWVRLWLKDAERFKLTSWRFTDEKDAKPTRSGDGDAPKPAAKAAG